MTGIRVSAAALYTPLAAVGMGWIAWQGRGLSVAHPAPWLAALPSSSATLASAASGLALAALVALGTRWLAPRAAWVTELQQEVVEALGPLGAADVAFLALSSGVAEELFFRGAMEPAWGLGWSSLLFGLAHPPLRPALVMWTLWAGGMGVALGALYEALGSLAGPVVAHAAINYWNLRFLLRHVPPSARRYPG